MGKKPRTAGLPVPVVVVGASAGGLRPIGQFLDHMPAKNGMAFVVIQHLDPAGKSLLPELLAKHTAMKVQLAEEGDTLRPNEVYVIAPGVYLTLKPGKLHLEAAPPGVGARMPVDVFLQSLAANHGPRGIGVILSGTGSDGALGLKSLKDAGGLTLVQEPGEAEHDGMPQQAIAAAEPDFVLPVAEMPQALLHYAARHYGKAKPGIAHDGRNAEHLQAVVEVLKLVAGQDFEQYKTGTVERRIERRMGLHGLESWEDYVALLHEDTAEVEALGKDLLIHVTQFFRDPDAFTYLAAQVLPELLSRHSLDQPVRIWVPGCSTGEEAYSLGMLFLEQIALAGRPLKLQIFATDIEDDALEMARAGVYPEAIQAYVSAERLEKFFTPMDQQFKIIPELRQSVVFSRHDLLKNPPFSRLDMVSCRNLFIYLRPDAQQAVLTLFHFALNPDGMLFLGSAESTGAAANLFAPVDPRQRLFRRLAQARATGLGFPLASGGTPRGAAGPVMRSKVAPPLAELVERKILEAYAPAAVATNAQYAALYYVGPIDRYLQLASGEPHQDVLSMAREGLRPTLREAIARALRSKRPVTVQGVRFKQGGAQATVTIEVQQIEGDLALVSFVDEREVAPGAGPRPAVETTALAQVQDELSDTRKELNRTIRELRRTNEDMMATNEEAVSLNEELLSANEELETSKEELQSLNEELTTLNGQLRQSLEQQQQLSTDLTNLLNTPGMATLLLDSQLNIKLFNPAMKELFAILDKDIGRPISDLLPRFADPDLLYDATKARANGAALEKEVQAETGTWYRRVVQPYRTEAGDIRGEVVTFTDISQLKQAALDAATARGFAETIVETIHEPLVVIDPALKILSANPAFGLCFGLALETIAGKKLYEVDSHVLQHPELQALVERVMQNYRGSDSADLDASMPDGRTLVWKATARHFAPATAEPSLILLTFNEITNQKRVVRQQLQILIDALPGPILGVDQERTIRFANTRIEPLFGYSLAELIGQKLDILLPHALRSRHEKLHADFIAQLGPARPMGNNMAVHGLTKDGEEIPVDVGLSPVLTSYGPVVVATVLDLRLQKRAEAQLREAAETADRANLAKSRFLAAASHDLRQPLQTLSLLLGVLGKRVGEPEAKTIVGKLEDTIVGMSELLDTLLDINQIESGSIKPEITNIPLADFFTRMGDLFGPIAAAKGLELRILRTSAVIRSDRHLLERIVSNLLSNALKYTDRGKVLLGCRRRGGKVWIEVWDTGVGIPEESMQTVFDEFHRLNPNDSSKFGLGLGLYIVQRLSLLLEHRVKVRSQPGKGTLFALSGQAGDEVALRRAQSKAGAVADPQAPLVLLVEDNQNQLDSMRLLLEVDGYRVAAVRRGEEALAAAGEEGTQPDVVLADYNLIGGLNGLEVIKELRHHLGRHLPALIVSGDKSASARQAFTAQAQAFITKPVKAAELLATLGALVETVRPGWLNRRARSFMPPPPAPAPSEAGVCVIDDDPEVCEALRLALEAEGHAVTAYHSAQAFMADPGHGKFRCLVVDVGSGERGMDGLELQSRLKVEHATMPIVFVTGSGDLPKAVKAIRNGAADFLLKPFKSSELCASVALALANAERDGSNFVEHSEIDTRLASLTERERQVMEHIAAGEASKIVAADLGISQRTVEHHRQSVMRKMGVKSLAALVRKLGQRSAPG